MTNQSRRQFLKTGALFGAASAAAAVSAPAFSTEAPQKWDETTGLLIVGTGFAGCAAALEAHYLGAKKEEIMLVDKMSTPGGNSIINGGAVAAAGTDMQEKEGIKDSADLLFADIMKAGGGLCHPALARRIAVYAMTGWSQEKVENGTTEAKPNGYEFTTGIVHRF